MGDPFKDPSGRSPTYQGEYPEYKMAASPMLYEYHVPGESPLQACFVNSMHKCTQKGENILRSLFLACSSPMLRCLQQPRHAIRGSLGSEAQRARQQHA